MRRRDRRQISLDQVRHEDLAFHICPHIEEEVPGVRRREPRQYQVEVIYTDIAPVQEAAIRRQAICYVLDRLLRKEKRRIVAPSKGSREEYGCAP